VGWVIEYMFVVQDEVDNAGRRGDEEEQKGWNRREICHYS